MVSVYELKPRFQALLRPLVMRLANAGITANQVTLAAAILSILIGAFLTWALIANNMSMRWLGLLPAVLFIRMALNAIDGMLAREHDMKSPLGAILNELGDVVSDAALYLPFIVTCTTLAGQVAVIAIVILAMVSEMTGVVGQTLGASRRYDGPMGKSDRALAFGIIGFVFALGVNVANVPWLQYVYFALLILLVLTIYNRGKKALAEIASASTEQTESKSEAPDSTT